MAIHGLFSFSSQSYILVCSQNTRQHVYTKLHIARSKNTNNCCKNDYLIESNYSVVIIILENLCPVLQCCDGVWLRWVMVGIFSAKLIPLHTRGWGDRQDRNILIWRWCSSNIVLMFFRALQGNLPLSFDNTTKLFLWFWITVKAFFLYPTLKTIKFCYADLTCCPLTLFKESGTSLEVCQGHSYIVLSTWNYMFATIRHKQTWSYRSY